MRGDIALYRYINYFLMDNTLHIAKGKDKVGILFVCLGNICRSPAAQGVMERLV